MASETLDSVLRSLHNSVLEAEKLTEQQHIRQLRRYCAKGAKGNNLGKPEMLTLSVPGVGGKSGSREDAWHDISVPQMALVPPSSIGIKQLRVRFSVQLQGFSNQKHGKDPVTGEKIAHSGPIDARLDFTEGSGVAEIEVTFEKATPPDSIVRIADLLNRTVP